MKNFEESDNCDPVWHFAVFSNRHGDNFGLVGGAYSSIFLDTDSVEEKGKKTSRLCVIEREYSNKLYELGCFPIKPTDITKTFIWPTSGP